MIKKEFPIKINKEEFKDYVELTNKQKMDLIKISLEYLKQEDIDPESFGYEYNEDIDEKYSILREFICEYKPKSKQKTIYVCKACEFETINEKEFNQHKGTQEHFTNVKTKYPQAYKEEYDRLLPSMNYLYITIKDIGT